MRHLGWFVLVRGRQRAWAHRAHARAAGRSRAAEGGHARPEGAEGRARRVGAEWVAEKAVAIAVFPSVKKGGLVVGGHFGRGVLSARSAKSGTWSSPALPDAHRRQPRAADWRAGGRSGPGRPRPARTGAAAEEPVQDWRDASVAAGPVGRDAEASTDIQMRAKILSYSRTRGLFAGITLNGLDGQAGP